MNGCKNLTCLIISILIVAGCVQKRSIENAFYKPYFQRIDTDYQYMKSGVLDTLALLFKSEPPGLKDEALLYKYKSSLYRDRGSFDSSLLMLDVLKTFLNEHQTVSFYQELYSETLFAIVDLYTRSKQYDAAMNALMDTRQYIETHPEARCLNVRYYSIVANMQMELGRQRLAAAYFLKSYSESESCDIDLFDKFYNSYGSLGAAAYCYMETQMYDSAQYYYDKAMSYIIANESKFPDKADYMELCKAITSGNSAMVKKSLHQYDEAEKLLIAAIDKTNITYPVYAASSRLDLANIYLETGKLKEAKQMLNVVDSIDKTSSPLMDNHRYKLDLYKKNYYTAIGDYQKAMPFYDAAFKYKDSVEFARKMDISRDPGLEFEKKVQIAANELLKAQYGQRSFQLLAAVLLMVLVLIVTVFIWLHLKRTARHAKMLEYLNHEIHLKNTDIKDAYASLESSYRANKMLLQIVAHDLKNPIVGITNLAKLLAKNASTPDLKENFSHIVTASTTATNLINNLMDKKEKKYEEIEKEVNDMTGLLQYCTELMKPKAEQKKQKLLLTAAPAKALINKDEMWRVITNIINNAIKFSPENTSIDIRLQEQDSKVLLSVKDQGIGIPPNMLTVLFTAGPEIQRSGTAGEPSYGLGLKISKRIVEEHHGQLRVESVEGEGTTFYVILPAA